MKQKTFRIVNKSKKGVILSINKNKMEMTWEEFNNSFVMCEDKLHCTLNEREKEKLEKIDRLVDKALVGFFGANSSKGKTDEAYAITNFMKLGSAVNEIAEELEISIAEAADLVQQRVNTAKQLLKPHFPSEKKLERGDEEVNTVESSSVTSSTKPTFADLPGMDKLKAILDNKKEVTE